MNAPKAQYTLAQAAAICGVGFRKMARWVRKGLLSVEDGEDPGITKDNLIDFLRSRQKRIPPPMLGTQCPRALIVEDNLPMAHAIERTLLQLGFVTKIVAGGIQAGHELAGFAPTLVTLDLSIPELSGHGVLGYLKRLPEASQAKVIVISGGDDAAIMRALAEGASGFVKKPFRPEQLKRVVGEVSGIAA